MADVIYLKDGSVHTVKGKEQEFFELLLRDKLGDDAARFFRENFKLKNYDKRRI